ncbi:MAG: hypothetical protein NTW11_01765 [Candidatus Staskawiczbacteria bacterium]|nr:hypothetical protein [Candidatus Staskawiczbacteria bacterium]
MEIIIVIAILIILLTIAIANFPYFNKSYSLNNNTQEFISTLRLAQSKTLASENYNKHGVYINTGVTPNQYILFRGATYAGGAILGTYTLDKSLEFYNISLGGGSEITFDKLTGAADELGSVGIRVKSDTGTSKTIYVASSGAVSLSPAASNLDANRTKDSRQVWLTYNRYIDTASENIVLTFNGSQPVTIPISTSMSNGQFEWLGTTSVAGSNQIIEINTHSLNSGTGNNISVFSIRRDMRYNNKTLKITISGDNTGYLAQYATDGSDPTFSSIYVSSLAKQ